MATRREAVAIEHNDVVRRLCLPHDGNHERQGENSNLTPKQMLERLGLKHVELVAELQHGIQAKVRQ